METVFIPAFEVVEKPAPEEKEEPKTFYNILADITAELFDGRVTHIDRAKPDGFFFVSKTGMATYIVFDAALDFMKHTLQEKHFIFFTEFNENLICHIVPNDGTEQVQASTEGVIDPGFTNSQWERHAYSLLRAVQKISWRFKNN